MSILVTGGAGFIGSNLVEDLLNSGEEVIVLDNMDTGSMHNLEGLRGDLNVIQADCANASSLDISPKAIYHLGMPSSSPMYKRNPFLMGGAVNGTISIFELAKRSGSKVVFASSSSLYNGLNPPHREDMNILVRDYYTEARFAIERTAELYHHLFGVPSVGLRFFSVYGPKEREKRQYANMVSQFIWELMAGRAPVIYGDGSQTRDFIHVTDIIRALKTAMASDYQGILNAGTGKAYSFNQVIDMLNERLGSEIRPVYQDNPIKSYVQDTMADTSRAEKALGFRARCSLKEGIDMLAEYYEGM